jgi:hypothetical protein
VAERVRQFEPEHGRRCGVADLRCRRRGYGTDIFVDGDRIDHDYVSVVVHVCLHPVADDRSTKP